MVLHVEIMRYGNANERERDQDDERILHQDGDGGSMGLQYHGVDVVVVAATLQFFIKSYDIFVIKENF